MRSSSNTTPRVATRVQSALGSTPAASTSAAPTNTPRTSSHAQTGSHSSRPNLSHSNLSVPGSNVASGLPPRTPIRTTSATPTNRTTTTAGQTNLSLGHHTRRDSADVGNSSTSAANPPNSARKPRPVSSTPVLHASARAHSVATTSTTTRPSSAVASSALSRTTTATTPSRVGSRLTTGTSAITSSATRVGHESKSGATSSLATRTPVTSRSVSQAGMSGRSSSMATKTSGLSRTGVKHSDQSETVPTTSEPVGSSTPTSMKPLPSGNLEDLGHSPASDQDVTPNTSPSAQQAAYLEAQEEIEMLRQRVNTVEAENQRLRTLLSKHIPVADLAGVSESLSIQGEDQPVSVKTLLSLRQEVTRLRDGAIRDWILHAYDLSAPL